MISVLIPVLNEERTIYNVIKFVSKCEMVNEIIVIDDKSTDNTVDLAKKAGAIVVTSTMIGKGASMCDGVQIAKNEIIVFIDGDIDPYPDNTIENLVNPILSDEADFVKSCFERQAGRVTELVAKPLLSLMFPKLTKFSQPLSGMIAGKKSFFNKIRFEDGYGVDIGILIDMFMIPARIKEVNIGYIENNMKDWRGLEKMSKEVSKTILKKAYEYSRPLFNLEELQAINIIRNQMEFSIKDSLIHLSKMIIFDIDSILCSGDYYDDLTEYFGFQDEYRDITSKNSEKYLTLKQIAVLLKNISFSDMIEFNEKMKLKNNISLLVEVLKNRGYVIGIITSGLDVSANYIKNKFGFDFSISNEIEFSNSIITGELKIPSFFLNNKNSKCNHNYCKSNVLLYLIEKYNIPIQNVISIGSSSDDVCLFRTSGIGIGINPESKTLKKAASQLVDSKDILDILNYVP